MDRIKKIAYCEVLIILLLFAASIPGINTGQANYQWGTRNLVLSGTISIGAKPFDISVAVADTALYFQMQFVAALKRNNIQVTNEHFHTLEAIEQKINFDSNEYIVQSMASLSSPPLYIMMNNTLQWSVNLEAEMWLRHLGVNFISDRKFNPQLACKFLDINAILQLPLAK
jgi:D-alanyl-D-alanine carboxypeptidase